MSIDSARSCTDFQCCSDDEFFQKSAKRAGRSSNGRWRWNSTYFGKNNHSTINAGYCNRHIISICLALERLVWGFDLYE